MKVLTTEDQVRVEQLLARQAEKFQHMITDKVIHEHGKVKFCEVQHLNGHAALGHVDGKLVCFVTYMPVTLRLLSASVTTTQINLAWRDQESTDAEDFLIGLYFAHIIKKRGTTVTAKYYSASALDRGEAVARYALKNNITVTQLLAGTPKKLETLQDWYLALEAGAAVIYGL